MLELHPRRMPHAVHREHPADPFLPWARSKHAPNTLPPLRVTPSSSCSSTSSLKPVFPSSTADALPTPPEMNGVSVRSAFPPHDHLGMLGGEGRFNSQVHGVHSQRSLYSPSLSSASYRPSQHSSQPFPAIPSCTTSVKGIRVHPPASTALVQSERNDSPIDASIAPDLRVPVDVNTPQKSMPELAAEVTCLFWFENGANLKNITHATSPPTAPFPYIPDAKPTPGFRKWVATLLSTTQVKQNVVMLALLFIYRLKKANPTVKGKPGSEYRLLTVALMLGNKFLDDNTYTNKTWADVSGISSHEVHIMEVEFLSNMRYSLFVSEADWKRWHITLGKFGTYISRAIQYWDSMARPAPLLPTGMHVAPALPSPPASLSASPHFFTSASPGHVTRSTTPLLHPQVSSAIGSPIRPLPELDLRPSERKRSYDEAAQEPPAKRHVPNYLNHLQPTMKTGTLPTPQSMIQARSTPATLPVPTVSSAPAASHVAPQLPVPARAMSLVYQPSTAWNPTTSVPTSIPPLQTTSLPPPSGLQSRQLSPFPTSAGSSPVSAAFPGTSTPYGHGRLSPSYYLAQRSSPYKPVRRPHTLLAPPPSMALHNPARQVNLDQMQYHSLGRPITERNYGHLPYNAWPQSQQSQQWPQLPLPASSVSRT